VKAVPVRRWEGLERFGAMPEWLSRLDDDVRVQAVLHEAIPGAKRAKLSGVRLKPGAWTARCTVVLDGEEEPEHLNATLVPPGTAAGAATKASPSTGSGGGARRWVEDLRLELVPAEPEAKLPALGMLTDPEESRAFLEEAIRTGTSAYREMRILAASPEVMRYSPGSRCTVLYRLTLPEESRAENWPAVVVAKTYHRSDKGRIAWDGMRALWESPLANSENVTIAEPLAWLPEHKILVQGPIPEDRTLKKLLLDALGQGKDAGEELKKFLAKAAGGLVELHHSGATSAQSATWEDELDEVREVMGRLTSAVPALGGAADPFLEDIERLATETPTDAPVAGHRSFRPAQVLLHGDDVGFIDFDGFCVAEPALDVALFRATARDLAMSVLPPDSPVEARLARVDDLCEHFLATYENLAPISRLRVALWESLDLFTNVLHSWTKAKPARLVNALALLQHEIARLPVS
jgi:hypothetical protein